MAPDMDMVMEKKIRTKLADSVMKKVAVLSDIHGNAQALSVIIDDIRDQEIETVLFCGDVVGYGPSPNRSVSNLKDFDLIAVQGNHDRAVVEGSDLSRFNDLGRQAIKWTRKQLDQEHREFIKNLPTTRALSNLSLSMMHGSPANPLWDYILDERTAYRAFQLVQEKTSVQLFGHTHQPACFEKNGSDIIRKQLPSIELDYDKRYLVNPGSVGQPRDGDWRSSYGIITFSDNKPCEFSVRRLEYNVEQTRQRILKAGLPQNLGDRLLHGK